LSELWSKLIDAIGRVSAFTRGYLLDAHLVSFQKNVLVIGYDPEFQDHLGLVDNSRNHTLITTKLGELGHPNAMVKFTLSEAPAGWQRPAPTPTPAPAVEKKPAPIVLNKEDFKNDPLIKKALEIFKGTIVEVRA
jgi:DNA polymerase-3 subunit gamma/tau